mmetsp:Transcript_8382/g.25180  ORF Transcript_8382/g.25180 Transcript_8382/m.25180 type:complete len:138 (+) Transcript_8382:195-608(+)
MEQIKDYGVEDHTRWWLETKNYENKLDHLARGEDVGPVSRGMCIDLLDKLDATGMSVSLSSLPPACLKQHAYESERVPACDASARADGIVGRTSRSAAATRSSAPRSSLLASRNTQSITSTREATPPHTTRPREAPE